MCLLGQIHRLSDDIILSFVNIIDNTNSFICGFIEFKIYDIANRNWIGAFDALHPEFSFDAAFKNLLVFGFYGVPTSGRFINKSSHRAKIPFPIYIKSKKKVAISGNFNNLKTKLISICKQLQF